MQGQEEMVTEIISYYQSLKNPKEQENLVAMLREIQEEMGCVPKDIQKRISKEFDVKESVISFIMKLYPSLREAAYRHRIVLCSGERCAKKDGAALIRAVKMELMPDEGGISKDGVFLVSVRNCLKHCKTSPNMLVDGELHTHVKEQDIPRILQKYRAEG
mgnify:CR=1 FL=1